MKLIDMQVIGAMRPPDGSRYVSLYLFSSFIGKNIGIPKKSIRNTCLYFYIFSNMLSERFSRHFNILNIDLFADATITSIFSRIVLWHLDTKGM